MLASAAWRYWQRDMIGMAACLLMAARGATSVFRLGRVNQAFNLK